ncbi:hypothetical protein B0H21DRAFT_733136 [Amylocystis lapponica]|nr:hypothetical protein B0H21DRAFT_733136 [Amylocystis lapponica]
MTMAVGSNRSANMSSGLLLDPMPSPSAEPSNMGPRFRPYASPDHHVTKGRYITSNDARGYIPVYEYPLNGQWIMLDMDDGYVLWTGIWKALGNSKADIVKIIESQPDLASQLRRVRGGYLKIQGTWMPYEIALRLSRRVAWPIRFDLVPLFGPTFPSTCLSPDQPGFGQIVKPGTGKRRTRRNVQSNLPSDSRTDWTVIPTGLPHSAPSLSDSSMSRSIPNLSRSFQQQSLSANTTLRPSYQSDSPVMLHVPYVERPLLSAPPATSSSSQYDVDRRLSPSSDRGSVRYSPYPSPTSLSSTLSAAGSRHQSHTTAAQVEFIKLPSIQSPPRGHEYGRPDCITLPPISAMDDMRDKQCDDSVAVLRRLKSDDTETVFNGRPSVADLASQARLGVPAPVYKLSEAPFAGARRVSLSIPSSRGSSASTLSPSLSPSSYGGSSASAISPHLPPPPSESGSSHVRAASPPSRPWEQRIESPSSVRRSEPHVRDQMDFQLSQKTRYAEDRVTDTRQTWRPW